MLNIPASHHQLNPRRMLARQNRHYMIRIAFMTSLPRSTASLQVKVMNLFQHVEARIPPKAGHISLPKIERNQPPTHLSLILTSMGAVYGIPQLLWPGRKLLVEDGPLFETDASSACKNVATQVAAGRRIPFAALTATLKSPSQAPR